MELTPQALHAVEFREARRGGYNTRDVDDFIERIAGGVSLLHDRVREAMARAEAAEARAHDLQRQLDEGPRRSRDYQESDETLRRTLVLAQRTADATIKEAKEEAARTLGDARDEAARTRAEAEDEARRGADEARRAAEEEVAQLVETRDALSSDIELLENHLEAQRDHLATAISELQRVVDDPDSLRPMERPALADPELPRRVTGTVAAPNGNAGLPSRQGHGASSASGTGAAGPTAPETNGGSSAPVAGTAPQAAAGPQGPTPPPPGNRPALPSLPQRQKAQPAIDLGPPTQPVPFGFPPDTSQGWSQTELREARADDAPIGPPPPSVPPGPTDLPASFAFRPPPPPGEPSDAAPESDTDTDTDDGAGRRGGRPSEWGRKVFDPDKPSGNQSRFRRPST